MEAGSGTGFVGVFEVGVGCWAVVEEVVEVAADGTGGVEADGDLRVGGVGGGGGHEAELHLAGHVEVALHALFFFVDALVETGVDDGDGDLGGEGGEGAEVVFVVVVDAGVFEVDDADDAALVDEGDGELGAGFGVLRRRSGGPCGRRATRMGERSRAAWPMMPWPRRTLRSRRMRSP